LRLKSLFERVILLGSYQEKAYFFINVHTMIVHMMIVLTMIVPKIIVLMIIIVLTFIVHTITVHTSRPGRAGRHAGDDFCGRSLCAASCRHVLHFRVST
jgi:hypothetical protein